MRLPIPRMCVLVTDALVEALNLGSLVGSTGSGAQLAIDGTSIPNVTVSLFQHIPVMQGKNWFPYVRASAQIIQAAHVSPLRPALLLEVRGTRTSCMHPSPGWP